jgi:hypothetical protein
MAEVYKILGQADLAATTLTDIYTVPALTSTVVSSVVLANRGGALIKVRLSVAIAGAANANQQYLYFDKSIAANDTLAVTLGITLATTDKIRAQSDTATCEVNVFGTEVS